MAEDDFVTITVTLPEGQERWRPYPFPGCELAKQQGCSCPTEQPWPGRLTFGSNCPVHELETPLRS
jgi:hypothetical protein